MIPSTQPNDNTNHEAGLAGPPALPFVPRAVASESWRRRAAVLDWAILAGAVCTAPAVLRAHGLAARVQLLQLVCLGAACLGMLLWRRAAFQSAAPPARRRAYCRRFELTSLLFRICWFDVNGRDISAGPAGLLAGRLFAIGALPADSGRMAVRLAALAAHVLHLLVSSSALVMMVQALRPLRLSLSIVAQVVLASHRLRNAPVVCAAGPLAEPTAQALTRRTYAALSLLSHLAPLPMGAANAELSAEGECAATLRFAQLALGLLAPLGVQAVCEARLWAAHARQRRRAGLPPEQGLDARLYAGVLSVSEDEVIRPYLYMLGAMLLGLCWSTVVLATAAGNGGAAA